MRMDAKMIEEEAIGYIYKQINLTDYLSPYIAKNEKEPTWDGFIYVYKSNRKTTDNLNGRLPVQVKGHYSLDLSNNEISFSMDIAHLKNYKDNGGAILFVVYLNKNVDRTDFNYRAYYAELTPIMLMNILAGCKQHQKSVNIHLKTLPRDPDKFSNIVLNCLENCRKQESFSNADLPTIKELSERGVLEGIQIFVSGYGPQSNCIHALVNSDTYFYAQIRDCAVPQPLPGVMIKKTVTYPVERDISVAGIVYYQSYHVQVTEESSKILVGDSFEIVMPNDTTTTKLNIKPSSMLRKLAKDMPFIIAMIENLNIAFGNQTLDLSELKLNFLSFDLEEAKKNAENSARLVHMLDKQGCFDDIDINTLSGDDWANLDRLAIATLDRCPIPHLMPGLPLLAQITIGTLRFILMFQPTEENGDTYYIKNVLGIDRQIYVGKKDDNEKLPAPISIIYKKEDYKTASNILYDRLLPQFKEFEMTPYIYDMANEVMLRVLWAHDEVSGTRKNILYKTALAFAEWLETAPADVWDRRISTLNRLQIIKRRRLFTEEEEHRLYSIIAESADRRDIMVGAYLLLDQQGQADFYLQMMNKEERETLLQYPIGYFRKGRI